MASFEPTGYTPPLSNESSLDVSGSGTSASRTISSSRLQHQDKAPRLNPPAGGTSSSDGSRATGAAPSDAAPAIVYVHEDGPLEIVSITSGQQSVISVNASSEENVPAQPTQSVRGAEDAGVNAALHALLDNAQHYRLDAGDHDSTGSGVGQEPDVEDAIPAPAPQGSLHEHAHDSDDADDEDASQDPQVRRPATGGTPPQGTQAETPGSESDGYRANGANAQDGPGACPATGGAASGSATPQGELRSGVGDNNTRTPPHLVHADADGCSATGAAPDVVAGTKGGEVTSRVL